MSNIRRPTVHLNGTPAERLFEQNLAAAGAIRAAIAALHAAAPHGRDYYPQDVLNFVSAVNGEVAYAEARRQHNARIERLRSVLAEVEEIAEHVASVMDDRAAKRELGRMRRGDG